MFKVTIDLDELNKMDKECISFLITRLMLAKREKEKEQKKYLDKEGNVKTDNGIAE